METNDSGREEPIDKEILNEALKSLDIPFNWDISEKEPQSGNLIDTIKEKDEEIIDSHKFKYRNFILQIILSYEYYKEAESDITQKTKKYLAAREKLKSCEELIYEKQKDGCEERLFLAVHETLLNVVLGCEAFVMMKGEMFPEAKEVLKRVCVLNSSEQKAALCGIKASIFMEYGKGISELALEYALQAKQLDPSVAEWHFITGNLMARVRRLRNFMYSPQKEEVINLENAVKLSDNHRYKVHLAQTYREQAFRLFNTVRYDIKNNPEIVKEVDDTNNKSSDLYRDLLSRNPDDPRVLAKCAFGLTKLPPPLRDVGLAIEAIERAYELSPNNPTINHYIGVIYDRWAKKPDEAMKYYQTAFDLGVYGAAMDLISLKFRNNLQDYNPLPDFKKVTEVFVLKDRYFQTLAQIASYIFFYKNNILEAWNYMEKIITMNPDHTALRTHKSITVRMNEPCDLCEVVFDEIKLVIAHQSYETESHKNTLMKIGSKLRHLCPRSHEIYYNYLKRKILDKSKHLMSAGKKDYTRRSKTAFRGKGKGWPSSKQVNTEQSFYRNRSKSNSQVSMNQQRTSSKNRSNSRNRQSNNKERSNSVTKEQKSSKNRRNSPIANSADEWQQGSKTSKSKEALEWFGANFVPKTRHASFSNFHRLRNSSLSPMRNFYESFNPSDTNLKTSGDRNTQTKPRSHSADHFSNSCANNYESDWSVRQQSFVNYMFQKGRTSTSNFEKVKERQNSGRTCTRQASGIQSCKPNYSSNREIRHSSSDRQCHSRSSSTENNRLSSRSQAQNNSLHHKSSESAIKPVSRDNSVNRSHCFFPEFKNRKSTRDP